ncbi:hydroxyethylthiazole kinase [Erwinia tracheiphila PSU-1]|nr:hydroxyethylthiazole kinase [Erwinia tracheiphila PSU-1]
MALVAWFAALPGGRLTHIASACRMMSLAVESARVAASEPGSFGRQFIDELFQLSEACAV